MVAKKLILIMMLITSIFISACAETAEETTETFIPEISTTEEIMPDVTKEFNIIAREGEFEPATIHVQTGDKVMLIITSDGVSQGFVISGLGINDQLVSGKTTIIEFIAGQAGTYEITCGSNCEKESAAMNGKIIIE